MTLQEAKAAAYDALANVEYYQAELKKLNQTILELAKEEEEAPLKEVAN